MNIMGAGEIVSEEKLRALVLIIFAILFVLGFYVLSFILVEWNFLRVVYVFMTSIFGAMFLQVAIPIMRQYIVRDNYAEQVRTNMELQNLKLLKELGYKVDEKYLTNPLRLLIGKSLIFEKEKSWKLKQEKKAFKKRWKKLRQKKRE